jgi:hypothetical protein
MLRYKRSLVVSPRQTMCVRTGRYGIFISQYPSTWMTNGSTDGRPEGASSKDNLARFTQRALLSHPALGWRVTPKPLRSVVEETCTISRYRIQCGAVAAGLHMSANIDYGATAPSDSEASWLLQSPSSLLNLAFASRVTAVKSSRGIHT